ncbi:MAG: efflux RND transporter periplasmic adaptor subunit [Sphingobium sp.]|nr:efflux RND transporter periplasmic adaptor subunit [Sphingobium sp.]
MTPLLNPPLPPIGKVNVHLLLRRTLNASGAATLLLGLSLSACGGKSGAGGPGGPGGRDSAPKSVGFVIVRQGDVAIETELPGRTSAYRTSEVRPQITGIIRRRLFTEGALVRAGQPLYEIDPRPYQASFNEASANLKSAQASEEAARAVAERYKPLADIEAVSKQDYTNALAAARQANAAVAQRRAQVETAQINLRYTSVPAPISGRIGRSLVTDGGLVTANQATALAQINQLDPIYVDIQQSAAELIALRRAMAGRDGAQSSAEVKLKLEDGSDYGLSGRVQFAETIVDEHTGTVTLRAQFPNPDGLLLPGMFVRARLAQAVEKGVFLVPQAAVSRDSKGQPQVWIVGADNKAELRPIVAPRTNGTDWVITSGVKAGERVILQGTGSLKPGQAIKPVPADTPQHVGPPAKGGAGQPGSGR